MARLEVDLVVLVFEKFRELKRNCLLVCCIALSTKLKQVEEKLLEQESLCPLHSPTCLPLSPCRAGGVRCALRLAQGHSGKPHGY